MTYDLPKPQQPFVTPGPDGRLYIDRTWLLFLNQTFDMLGGTGGVISISSGGTGSDLSGTGGAGQVVRQNSVGGDFSVGALNASEVANGQALTRVSDTNVTLTLGGSATSALLAGVSLTLGWSGTLASGRLNANVVQSVVDDTNVTGVIATQSLTLGWTGTLSVARGGTGQGTYAPALLDATLTSGRIPTATTGGRLTNGPAPVTNGTYNFAASVVGQVTSLTFTSGLVTAVTTL